MSLAADLRVATRLLVKQPGLTAAAVVALALGVGLPTLLFSIAYGIFLRGLPCPNSDRIVAIPLTNVAMHRTSLPVTIHDLADWRASQTSFDGLAAFQTSSLNVTTADGHPERLAGAFLTGNGFEVIGARALMGRTFGERDAANGRPSVVVLGYAAWTTKFGGDPGIIGRAVRANGQPATVIGVMPRGFGFPSLQEAWMPLKADALAIPRGQGPSLMAYGRLKAGMSISGAQADLAAIAGRAAAAHPDTNRNLVPSVQRYTELMGGGAEGRFAMLLTMATGLGVLFIACANVANLLLARAASRTREMSVRAALGASRARIVLQGLVESTLLAAAGTGVGLLVAYAGAEAFSHAMVNANPPYWIVVALDGPSVLFATVLTALSALASGLVPAWRASSGDVASTLKDETRGSGGLRIGRLSRALITVEIVLSFGLLMTSGLMVRSIVNVATHQYAFATADVLTARVVLPEGAYDDAGRRDRFVETLRARLATLPGVRSATITSDFPGMAADRTMAAVEGTSYADRSHYPLVRLAAVDPHFFATFGRPLLAGRSFSPEDNREAPRVAIVNESFVRQYLQGRRPVGARVRFGRDTTTDWAVVVGVAPDLSMSGAENLEPAGAYVPLAQSSSRSLGLALRGVGASSTSAVRAQVAALDPDLPINTTRTLREAIDASMWQYTLFGSLLVAVGAAALFLSTVGLYSLMAFAARQRMREIGLRLALGAQSWDVARLVAGEVASQVGIGMAGGAGFATLLSSTMRVMVFHVAPHDPVLYASIAVALLGAVVAAAVVPVRRALRVDPALSLRAG